MLLLKTLEDMNLSSLEKWDETEAPQTPEQKQCRKTHY